MNIIAVDDEYRVLNTLVEAIQTVQPDADVTGFTSPNEALEYARGSRVDVAFLDIKMGEMSGLFLAKRLKDICGQTNIIFVTAYADYMGDAMALRASGYVMKPVDPNHVREEIDNLRNPVKLPDKGLRVRTFGNFEVFTDGTPLHFPRAKSKELFAYLVHKNGASCTIRELSAVLFEDNTETNVRPYISALIKTLEEAGMGDVIIKRFNSISADTSKFDCDFYRFLKGDAAAVNEYTGEYMAQYSWADFIAGYLDERAKPC